MFHETLADTADADGPAANRLRRFRYPRQIGLASRATRFRNIGFFASFDGWRELRRHAELSVAVRSGMVVHMSLGWRRDSRLHTGCNVGPRKILLCSELYLPVSTPSVSKGRRNQHQQHRESRCARPVEN